MSNFGFGSINCNGPDAYQKAKDFIEDYNRDSESKIASITQFESGSVVVAVVDESAQNNSSKWSNLFRRWHYFTR